MKKLLSRIAKRWNRITTYMQLRRHVVRNCTWTKDERGVVRRNKMVAVPTDATLQTYFVRFSRTRIGGDTRVIRRLWPVSTLRQFKQDFCY